MNALQIIPPKPVATVRRSAFRFCVSGAILLLLLALVGGMNMSRGEEGAASEPGAAIVLKDNRDNVSDKDVSPSTTQPATASAGATTQVSGTGSGELRTSAPAQSAALPAMPALACIRNYPDVGSDAGEPPATEAKPDSGRAPINDRNGYDDRDGSRARAMPSPTCSASAASKEDLTSKPEDGRGRRTSSDRIAGRLALTARRANQSKSEAGYPTRPADAEPVWVGPPPIIYGSGAVAQMPYVAVPADAMNRQGWIPSALTGRWERVVDAPAVVLNGGKRALDGVVDLLW